MLARRSRDFDAAEDAVQEALVAAATHWPRDGVPDNPRGWLLQAATRRLVDHVRADASRRRREVLAAQGEPAGARPTGEDDTLTVLLLCCHPSLTPASAIALTLRAVGGLTTAEVAHAFAVPEATMAQRISRAKQTVRASGEPFARPTPEELPGRLRSVLHVLYLVFNEGYTSSRGPELHRVELVDEAVRITRLVRALLPDDADVAGLLALMLLVDARRPARTDDAGDPVPLPQQDRTRWDAARIAEGLDLLDRALAGGPAGEYTLQAAIAAVHDRAPTADATDWPRVLALYGALERLTGNPVVTVNRAVAAAMVDGAAAGLALLDGLDDRLGPTHRLDAVRAHLHELAGDAAAALDHYRRAAAHATNLPEQRHLAAKVAELTRGGAAVVSVPDDGGGRAG
ncbi:RNA polymerase sigma24 factor [Cellulomonas cellasea]|uniref:RNA polymerase sigma24 factor n=1 Tax=Cellulomonas cellasea TaxID=43670 RepID=A0A4Y3KY47_9CELL|nr:RNA polymerase sigma24 factor [Cellulomonas cellasea]